MRGLRSGGFLAHRSGVFAEGGIVEDEVCAGLFDGAELAISFVNWQDPDGHGEIRLRRGTWARRG